MERRPENKKTHAAPRWRVFYGGGFFSHYGRDHRGREISVKKHFKWEGENWYVPAVYITARGLVVDILSEVEPEKIKEFIDKWKTVEDEGRPLTQKEREEIERESPHYSEFSGKAFVNGKALQWDHSQGRFWIPEGIYESGSRETRWILEHYGCGLEKGWGIYRMHFKWGTRRKPDIKSLDITLVPWPFSVTAASFKTPGMGDRVEIFREKTGERYTLTVLEAEAETLTWRARPGDMEYPENYVRMTYKIWPELPEGEFWISDDFSGDLPRKKALPGDIAAAASAASIGVIGGADGPTVLFLGGGPEGEKTRVVCSSLYFEKPEEITWRFAFKELLRYDVTVRLIACENI